MIALLSCILTLILISSIVSCYLVILVYIEVVNVKKERERNQEAMKMLYANIGNPVNQTNVVSSKEIGFKK